LFIYRKCWQINSCCHLLGRWLQTQAHSSSIRESFERVFDLDKKSQSALEGEKPRVVIKSELRFKLEAYPKQKKCVFIPFKNEFPRR
jgi:hypothetical protein